MVAIRTPFRLLVAWIFQSAHSLGQLFSNDVESNVSRAVRNGEVVCKWKMLIIGKLIDRWVDVGSRDVGTKGLRAGNRSECQ